MRNSKASRKLFLFGRRFERPWKTLVLEDVLFIDEETKKNYIQCRTIDDRELNYTFQRISRSMFVDS